MSGRPANHQCKTRSKRRRWRSSLAIVLALVLGVSAPRAAPAAEPCSIEAHGETVYARVQAILKKKLAKAQEVMFMPYSEINIELLPGCVFKLDGKFQVKTQRAGQLKWKRFDAEFKRKDGAPMGFKKLKFRVSGG